MADDDADSLDELQEPTTKLNIEAYRKAHGWKKVYSERALGCAQPSGLEHLFGN